MQKKLSMRIIKEKIDNIKQKINDCQVEHFSKERYEKKYKEQLLLERELIDLKLRLYEGK